MKKALVHDWYYTNGGAEKVIKSINNIWDDFDHYALIDFLNERDRNDILKGAEVNTSFIQKLPSAKSNHRKFLQLFPIAVEQFDLRPYDLVISSSASIAKGVLTSQDQIHICYCHSPMRYAWDLYFEYLEDKNLLRGFKSWYAKRVLHKVRLWDLLTVNRVDYFIANSKYIANRIKKVYNRDSKVIYPPVDVSRYQLDTKKDNYYFTASRLVSYKKIDLIVRAFNKMPEKRLIVAGTGPELKKIQAIASPNIEILGRVEDDKMISLMQKAKAFVFAAKEDFGIIPVEAQSCGTPVIGFGKGGLLETVIDGETGIFFYEQTEESLINSVIKFELLTFDYTFINNHAKKFSKERFEIEFKTFVEEKINLNEK